MQVSLAEQIGVQSSQTFSSSLKAASERVSELSDGLELKGIRFRRTEEGSVALSASTRFAPVDFALLLEMRDIAARTANGIAPNIVNPSLVGIKQINSGITEFKSGVIRFNDTKLLSKSTGSDELFTLDIAEKFQTAIREYAAIKIFVAMLHEILHAAQCQTGVLDNMETVNVHHSVKRPDLRSRREWMGVTNKYVIIAEAIPTIFGHIAREKLVGMLDEPSRSLLMPTEIATNLITITRGGMCAMSPEELANFTALTAGLPKNDTDCSTITAWSDWLTRVLSLPVRDLNIDALLHTFGATAAGVVYLADGEDVEKTFKALFKVFSYEELCAETTHASYSFLNNLLR